MTIWRQSTYEGHGTISARGAGGTNMYFKDGGTAVYQPSTFRGDTCARFDGQANLVSERVYPTRVYWTGWMRPVVAIDANRLINALLSNEVIQASISVDTASKWRIRNEIGVTVATSTTTFVPGEWYGLEWWADSSGLGQELKIYDKTKMLLETLAGACGTLAFDSHREGILQGLPGWSMDLDDTSLSDGAVAISDPPVIPTRSGRAKAWDGSAWVLKPARVWDDEAWVAQDLTAWDGSAWIRTK